MGAPLAEGAECGVDLAKSVVTVLADHKTWTNVPSAQGRQSINRERMCQIVRIEDSIQWNLTNFHWTGGGSGEVRQSAIALPRTKWGAELAAEADAAAEKVEEQ